MKNLSVNYKSHLALNVTTLALLVKIVRTDNTTYTFTDHDKIITYDGEDYIPNNSFTPSDFLNASNLAVDNLDITGILSEVDNILEEDIYREFFYDAEIWVSEINYNSVADGINKILYGSLGEIVLKESSYVIEFRNLTYKLTRNIADTFSKTCRAELGDAKCGVTIDPDTWQASTLYCVGDIVKSTTYNGKRFVCVVEGTSNDTEGEPTWDETTGNITVEADGVEWVAQDAYLKSGVLVAKHFRFNITEMGITSGANPRIKDLKMYDKILTLIPDLTYGGYTESSSTGGHTGDLLLDNDNNTYWATLGTSNEYVDFIVKDNFSLDSFDLILDTNTYIVSCNLQVTYDNVNYQTIYSFSGGTPAYWQSVGWALHIPSDDIYISSLNFRTNSSLAPNLTVFEDPSAIKDGVLTWTTGYNTGKSVEISDYDVVNGITYIVLPMPYYIKMSDEFNVRIGCNHLFLGSDGTTATGHCTSRFNNALNFRGEPLIPTEDILVGGIGETNKEPYTIIS